jgi:tRNA (adenine22-N1)-methyltransferase
VSAPSLEKATTLLADYKNAKGILCDGLDKVDTDCDCVLIAGMGGENIIGILHNGFLPKTLVLQPMKNVDKLRVFLIEKGYKIEKDFLFKAESKFYNLIVATLGQDSLTQEEIIYGRDNLKNPTKDFLEFLKNKINKNKEILGGLSGEKFATINDQVARELALYERLRTKR